MLSLIHIFEKDPAHFPRLADHLAEAVLRNQPLKAAGEEGLQDMKLIAAIYQSAGRS